MKAAIAKQADKTLDSGSIIHWAEQVERDVPVTCGACGLKRSVKAEALNRADFSGLCRKCHNAKMNEQRRKTGVQTHSSGAQITWDIREPTDRKYKIGFICLDCGKQRITHISNIRNPDWKGRCSECITEHGLSTRITGQVITKSGRFVDYDKRDETRKRVLITCPGGKHPQFIL